MTDDRFTPCLDHVLRHEGGYVDHPADPGGATNMGITRKTLARWRNVSPWWNLPKEAVKALTRAEAARIYRAQYWEPCRAGDLPIGLDLALFDYAVNSGHNRAIRALQAVLGVVVDGVVGPLTLGAASRADVARTINGLCDARLGFLRRLAIYATFGRGWSSRVAAIRAAALALAPKSSARPKGDTPMDILSGYKTYIVAALMLLAGIAQILGIEIPALEGTSSGNMVLEALAIVFLRRGLKAEIAKA
ncbi:glycoside hydrolase family 108 protein [Devosia chinhatensis]|uniref:Uncharacterized protein n=1 Tax=Devosia chinhatensis TaxID=429727 RepID=A0A0F5FJP0_9HYPH|nr:glycosyl hydrolase 108 family protein [Devosia chinhatensis]KKB09046.1 hypothetical protein VE26_03175 [Devosia chinhatensis]